MNAIWYVMRAGEFSGPFTTAEVKERMRQGQIEPTDDLGTGNGEWQNARVWDELSTLPAKCVPGPENQAAFADDAAKYPAPPPLPTSAAGNEKTNSQTGCGERVIAFIVMGIALGLMKENLDAKRKNNNPLLKKSKLKQPPDKQ
jgi:hypothetical protein